MPERRQHDRIERLDRFIDKNATKIMTQYFKRLVENIQYLNSKIMKDIPTYEQAIEIKPELKKVLNEFYTVRKENGIEEAFDLLFRYPKDIHDDVIDVLYGKDHLTGM